MRRQFIINSIIAIGAAILLAEAVSSILPQFYSVRDIHQDYLMGLALRNGADPYQAVFDLWNQYITGPYYGGLRHPSPHPPIMPVLFLALSYSPLWIVSFLWFCASLLAAYFGITIVLKILGEDYQHRNLILALFAISVAGRHELMMGQVNCFIFLLIAASYLYLKRQQDWRSGALLGVALALKFFGWPLFLYLLCRKKIKACFAAIIVVVITYSIVAMITGSNTIEKYIRVAAPAADKYYAGSLFDISWMSLYLRATKTFSVDRLEDDRLLVVVPGKEANPTSESQREISVLIGLGLIFILLTTSLTKNFDTGFHRAIIISALASPIAWKHYLVPCLFTLIMSTCISDRRRLLPLIALAVPFFVSPDLLALDLLAWIGPPSGSFIVPEWVVLPALLPTILCFYAACTLELSHQCDSIVGAAFERKQSG